MVPKLCFFDDAYNLIELMAFLSELMDFWSSMPSFSESLMSRRRMTPARPTTDGKPNDVFEK